MGLEKGGAAWDEIGGCATLGGVVTGVRRDFYIYNEADFFVLYAEGGKAPDRREIAEDLGRAASDGYAVPVELVQDDCFHIRFVDEELTEEEAVEWVGKVEWDLRIPGGALALTAGLGPDDEVDEEGTCRVDVPPGDYRVTVYSYFPGDRKSVV